MVPALNCVLFRTYTSPPEEMPATQFAPVLVPIEENIANVGRRRVSSVKSEWLPTAQAALPIDCPEKTSTLIGPNVLTRTFGYDVEGV